MKRSRTELFSYLSAPLNNTQWSWGAERDADGAVFLVVWQDESVRRNGRHYSLVHNQSFWGDTTESLGLNERRRHLDLIHQGAAAYLIMARAKDARSPGAVRRIEDLDSEEVFVGGELATDEQSNVWIERVARMSVEQARLTGTTRTVSDVSRS
jgi:hypothetical protein